MRIKTSAFLICANSCHLLEDMRKLGKGGIDWLQFEIMDNHFVPNITLGPVIIKSLRDKTDLPFDTICKSPTLSPLYLLQRRQGVILYFPHSRFGEKRGKEGRYFISSKHTGTESGAYHLRA